MHAKCTTVRILLTVALSAGLVFSDKIKKKQDVKVFSVEESAGKLSGPYESRYPEVLLANNTLTTTNYATSEAPTSLSSRGTVIENTSLIDTNRGPVRFNESNNTRDIVETDSSKILKESGEEGNISNYAGDEIFTSTEAIIDTTNVNNIENQIFTTDMGEPEDTHYELPEDPITNFYSFDSNTNINNNEYQTSITETAWTEATPPNASMENPTKYSTLQETISDEETTTYNLDLSLSTTQILASEISPRSANLNNTSVSPATRHPDSENITEERSTYLTSSISYEQEQENTATTTSNAFQSSISAEIVLESTTLENNILSTLSNEMPDDVDGNSRLPHLNEDKNVSFRKGISNEIDFKTKNIYAAITDEPFSTITDFEQRSSAQEDEDYTTPSIKQLHGSTSSNGELPKNDEMEMLNTNGKNFDNSTIQIDHDGKDLLTVETETAFKQEENVPTGSDILDSSTKLSDISEETHSEDVTTISSLDSVEKVFKKVKNIEMYSPLHNKTEVATVNTDVTAAYSQSTVYSRNDLSSTQNIYETTFLEEDRGTSSQTSEPNENVDVTTNSFEHNTFEEELFDLLPSTEKNTKPPGYDTTVTVPESTSSATTIEYSGITNNQINISTKEEKNISENPSLTTLNLAEMNNEAITEEVSITVLTNIKRKEFEEMEFSSEISTVDDNLIYDHKQSNYRNSVLSETTTAFSEYQTNVPTKELKSSFVYPDWTNIDSDGLTTIEVPLTDTTIFDMKTTSKIKTSSDIQTTESVTASTKKEYFSSCKDAQITSYEITKVGKTHVEITWTLSYPYDSICHLKIKMSCNSTDDSFDWIVTYQNTTTNVSSSVEVSSLENLSEFTNYICTGQLLMDAEDEMVLSTKTFNILTNPEVPSDISFSILNKTPQSFALSWQRPTKIPGNLKNYHILIKKIGSHYIRDECSSESIGVTISYFSGDKDQFYNFTEAEPNYLYEVQILAEDEAGNSTGIKQEILTESSRSTEPLNVTSILHNYSNHCNADEYNTTLQLNWELPCNTNGELMGFEVQISEIIYSDTNFHQIGSSTSYRVQSNSDIRDLRYQLLVQNLNASCIYKVTILAITGSNLYGFPTNHVTQMTKDGCPAQPNKISSFANDSSSFILEWEEPEMFFGKIIDYNVLITKSTPGHKLSKDPTCTEHHELRLKETTNLTSFKFEEALPNFVYSFMIEARTSAGIGKSSEIKEVTTEARESEPIRNLEIIKIKQIITDKIYEYIVGIAFKEPCNTNGPFISYLIEEKGSRYGYPNVSNKISHNKTYYEVILTKPEYYYEFEIKVITENGLLSVGVKKNITTGAAIPMLDEKGIQCAVDEDNPTEIKVEMEKAIFSNENGKIIKYAIFLFEGVEENSILQKPSFGICNESCQSMNKSFPFKASASHQVTTENWNPFTAFRTFNNIDKYTKNNKDKSNKDNNSGVYKLTCKDCPMFYIGQTGRSFKKRIHEHQKCYSSNSTHSTYANQLIEFEHSFNNDYEMMYMEDGKNQLILTIGKKDNCSLNEFCRPLSENTNYIVLLRGSTQTTYRDVFVFVKTGINPSKEGFFIIPLVVLVLLVIVGIYLYSKRDRFFTVRFRSIPNTTSEETILRHMVAVKNFIAYYNKTQNDPTILRKQYEEIEDEIKIYKEQNVHTTFALKPENKRKNRYTNILPYDEYRVKLRMDEDDEISSDYINASYIKGATGEVEYIATQGPLEHTCKDFWKMVIQEKITVIVMVSQFVEKEKEKCFKYFPKNHENMMITEDLEVKCLTELQFDTHCIRTLLIRKDIMQFSVIHMQYLDWPDFGCPSGTYNMLSFCQEVRDRIQIEKGLMAVHCSAGVGRTGTLISLDILLQTMRKKREISVFECVMELRKQRTHMVQTEKQYVYIHTCLKDVLENCSLYSFDDMKKDEEHIYQNVNEKNRPIKGSKCKEKESAF